MDKKPATWIITFFISAVPATLGLSAGTTGKTLLPDGFILSGVEGKLVTQDSNDSWFFEFDSAINDDKGRPFAVVSLELLPSSALEKMTADANDGSMPGYRLWARVTKYKGRNFLFPVYFLPLSKVKQLQQSTSQQSQEKSRPGVIDANDELAIPQEILDRLESRRTVHKQPERRVAIKQNSILANRTGFISPCVMCHAYCAERVTRYVFVFDALGRSVQQTTLRLLPCQALELAELGQSAEPEPVRFKIAGIVTEYKGKNYLLLQRATRTYSHGNFGR